MNLITTHIPINYIEVVSGLIFIIFGTLTLISNKQEEAKCELKNPFVSGFLIIFVSETGNKIQIASGLFATNFKPVMVFIGVLFALTFLSIMVI